MLILSLRNAMDLTNVVRYSGFALVALFGLSLASALERRSTLCDPIKSVTDYLGVGYGDRLVSLTIDSSAAMFTFTVCCSLPVTNVHCRNLTWFSETRQSCRREKLHTAFTPKRSCHGC